MAKHRAPFHYARINNEAAYEAAIARRIQANANKTRRAKWFAAHADAARIEAFLFQIGEFSAYRREEDAQCVEYRASLVEEGAWSGEDDHVVGCSCRRVPASPLLKFRRSPFVGKLADSLEQWGALTDNQTAAIRKILAEGEGKIAKWDAEREAKAAADREGSKHVGTVGERQKWVLTVERSLEFEGQYGVTYINICRDADNNVVVYKGSNGWEKGKTVTCLAAVKAHDERDGVAQTVIQRPTKVGIA